MHLCLLNTGMKPLTLQSTRSIVSLARLFTLKIPWNNFLVAPVIILFCAYLGVRVGQIFDPIISTNLNFDLNSVCFLDIVTFIKATSALMFPRVVYIFLGILSLMKRFFRLLPCIPMLVLGYVLKLTCFLCPCNLLICIIMRGVNCENQLMLILLLLPTLLLDTSQMYL
jgi:hypothetical protein